MTVSISLLGGVGEFGRNCMLIDDEGFGAAIVVDCGLMLEASPATEADEAPRTALYPSFAPLEARRDVLCGYVITHGHDDHIGGLPVAMEMATAPVYATRFTRERVRQRFRRARLEAPEFMGVDTGGSRKVGPFLVEWIAVSHSIPDAAAVLIHTSEGALLHSGDFRVDLDPRLGFPTDLTALERAGDEGVALLMADSTGAPVDGDNPGEKSVTQPLEDAFCRTRGRFIVATFSPQIQRVQLLLDLAAAHGRRVFPLGRGMRDALTLARKQNLLQDHGVLRPEGELHAVPPSRACVIATGSQGERGAALWKLAYDEHPRLGLVPGDTVVLSARTIPGNELDVTAVVERLEARGIQVLDGQEGRHVSGHGFAGDLETLLRRARPQHFLPVHGEERHLAAHREIARRCGLAEDAIVHARNGHRLVVAKGRVHVEAWRDRTAQSDIDVGVASSRAT
ncbi:MAG: ribonuclease J [Myxococcota bacterium]